MSFYRNELIKLSGGDSEEDLREKCAMIATFRNVEHLTFEMDHRDSLDKSLIQCGLKEAIQNNNTIIVLSFNGDIMNDAGVGEVIKSLGDNIKITHLHFNGNIRIGGDSAKELSNTLGANKTLVNVSLENCNINHEGVKNICTNLENNRTLTTLSLKDNPIGDLGAKHIHTSIEDNIFAVTKLNLANSHIGDEGVAEVILALKLDTLFWIDLSGNSFSIKKAKSFVTLAQNAKKLLFIGLDMEERKDKGERKDWAKLDSKIMKSLENRTEMNNFGIYLRNRGVAELNRKNYVESNTLFSEAITIFELLNQDTSKIWDHKQRVRESLSNMRERKAKEFYDKGMEEKGNYLKAYHLFECALACDSSTINDQAEKEKDKIRINMREMQDQKDQLMLNVPCPKREASDGDNPIDIIAKQEFSTDQHGNHILPDSTSPFPSSTASSSSKYAYSSMQVEEINTHTPILSQILQSNLMLQYFIRYGLPPKERVFQRFLAELKEKIGTKPGKKCSCFISYARPEKHSVDKNVTQWLLGRLHEDLEKIGITTFLDMADMRGDLDECMSENIEKSEFFIIVGTPEYKNKVEKDVNIDCSSSSSLKKLSEQLKSGETKVGNVAYEYVLIWEKCHSNLNHTLPLIPLLYKGSRHDAFPKELQGILCHDPMKEHYHNLLTKANGIIPTILGEFLSPEEYNDLFSSFKISLSEVITSFLAMVTGRNRLSPTVWGYDLNYNH